MTLWPNGSCSTKYRWRKTKNLNPGKNNTSIKETRCWSSLCSVFCHVFIRHVGLQLSPVWHNTRIKWRKSFLTYDEFVIMFKNKKQTKLEAAFTHGGLWRHFQGLLGVFHNVSLLRKSLFRWQCVTWRCIQTILPRRRFASKPGAPPGALISVGASQFQSQKLRKVARKQTQRKADIEHKWAFRKWRGVFPKS